MSDDEKGQGFRVRVNEIKVGDRIKTRHGEFVVVPDRGVSEDAAVSGA